MFNISQFLEKFSKGLKSDEVFKKEILEVIEKEAGFNITPEKAEIKNGVVYLEVSPAAKNKIFINKEKILEDLKNLPIKIVDIR